VGAEHRNRKASARTISYVTVLSIALGVTVIAAPCRQPVSAMQTAVAGHRVDLDTTLSVREVIEENGSTKHDRTLETLRIRAAAVLTDWLRFDSTTIGTNGGPTMKADRSGVYNLDDAFQDVSPAAEFDEAYFDIGLPSVDVRLGKQKFAWGKLDRSQPNDLINPRSYIDPLLQDEAEQKIGVPALEGTYYLPDAAWLPQESRLTAVWVPKYVPFRFPLATCDLQGSTSRCDVERWFPPAALPPTSIAVPLPHSSSSLNVPLTFRTSNTLPGFSLANSAIALRYAATVRDTDVALYYYRGIDTDPAFLLSADAVGEPDPTSPIGVKPGVYGATVLTPEFHQIDSWGADFATALDRFSVRGEGAFVRGRPFPRDLRGLISNPSTLTAQLPGILRALAAGAGQVPVDLPPSAVVRDAIEWGLGSDYTYAGYMLLLQVNQTDVLHNSVQLLIKDVETRLLANIRKSFFADRVQLQLVTVHAIESDYTFVRPRLTYRLTDNIAAQVGYLFIAGRAESIGGQYRRNGEGWMRLEYTL